MRFYDVSGGAVRGCMNMIDCAWQGPQYLWHILICSGFACVVKN